MQFLLRRINVNVTVREISFSPLFPMSFKLSTYKKQAGISLVSSLVALSAFVGTMALVMNSWSGVVEDQFVTDTKLAKSELQNFFNVALNAADPSVHENNAISMLRLACEAMPEQEHYYSTRVDNKLRLGFSEALSFCADVKTIEKSNALNKHNLSTLIDKHLNKDPNSQMAVAVRTVFVK